MLILEGRKRVADRVAFGHGRVLGAGGDGQPVEFWDVARGRKVGEWGTPLPLTSTKASRHGRNPDGLRADPASGRWFAGPGG